MSAPSITGVPARRDDSSAGTHSLWLSARTRGRFPKGGEEAEETEVAHPSAAPSPAAHLPLAYFWHGCASWAEQSKRTGAGVAEQMSQRGGAEGNTARADRPHLNRGPVGAGEGKRAAGKAARSFGERGEQSDKQKAVQTINSLRRRPAPAHLSGRSPNSKGRLQEGPKHHYGKTDAQTVGLTFGSHHTRLVPSWGRGGRGYGGGGWKQPLWTFALKPWVNMSECGAGSNPTPLVGGLRTMERTKWGAICGRGSLHAPLAPRCSQLRREQRMESGRAGTSPSRAGNHRASQSGSTYIHCALATEYPG